MINIDEALESLKKELNDGGFILNQERESLARRSLIIGHKQSRIDTLEDILKTDVRWIPTKEYIDVELEKLK